MKEKDKRELVSHRFSRREILKLGLFAFLGGCTSVPSEQLQTETQIYRSNDYIAYQLQAGDTATLLAKRFLGDSKKAWLIEEANRDVAFKPGQYIAIPLKPSNKAGIFGRNLQQVPVLCYHRFEEGSRSSMCMPPAIFEKQMEYLKIHGFRTITDADMLAFLEYRQPLHRKSIWITIDDGYRSGYSVAAPILKKYNFTATFYIYTSYVGVSTKAITWQQLKSLKADGFSIGSHTVLHSDLSKPGEKEGRNAYIDRLRKEIVDSKKIIDGQLNQDTLSFAYPYGRVNQDALKFVKKAGYRLAATVNRGGNVFFERPFLLHRDMVLKQDIPTFVSRLNTLQLAAL